MKLSSRQIEVWKTARELTRLGKIADAARAYDQILRQLPNHPALLYEAGKAAMEGFDFSTARSRFIRSSRLCGRDARLLVLIGSSLGLLRQRDDANRCFQAALHADPNAIDALKELITGLEQCGKMEAARDCLEPFLHSMPRDPMVRYLHAFLLHRSGNQESSETILRDLVAGPAFDTRVFISCHYLLADILDKTERHGEAMECLSRIKQWVLGNPDFETTLQHYDAGCEQRKKLLEHFTPEMIRQWQSAAPFHPDNQKVAFLGGHPRSGTTLLERVLDSHPELTAFDESPAFYCTVEPFLRRFGPDHHGIAQMTSAYRQQLLWEAGGACASQVWLDKNPSLTACLHSWLRSFPGVKVVMALRHPLDVMLSCYFLDSSMNALSSNFLSLERISKHYRDMMDVWLRMRDLGGFEWIESRYEDTVADPAAEGKRVTEFLGLDWRDEQLEFHQKKQRTAVVAPTYHDVTQPVHQRSKQRWLKYEPYLTPHLELLEPYMKQLGYD